MRIMVGTANPGKVAAVRAAFAQLFGEDKIIVDSENAASLVPDQPRTSLETLNGAKNRADSLHKKYGDKYHLYVGPEGGIRYTMTPGLQIVNWMAIRGNDGHTALSFDASFPLPPKISEFVSTGMEMGPACDRFLCMQGKESCNIKQLGGIDKLLSDGFLTRDDINRNMVFLCMTGFQDLMSKSIDLRSIGKQAIIFTDQRHEIKPGAICIAMGSDSTVKIESAKDIFQKRFNKKVHVQPFDVEPELTNLAPKTEEEIYNMAMLRSIRAEQKAAAAGAKCDYAVGLQGGINLVEGVPMILDVAIVRRSADGKIGQAVGGGYTLPMDFYELVQQNNGDIGRASNIYFADRYPTGVDVKTIIGIDGELSRGHISRKDKCVNLICVALNQIVHDEFY